MTYYKKTFKTLSTILFLFVSVFLFGQNNNSFIQKPNHTGMVFAPEEVLSLKEASDELQDVFPGNYGDKFRVYDFGFYVHGKNFDSPNTYPEQFERVVSKIEQSTQYYLVFGRQIDPGSSANNKIWLRLKLPENSHFPCLNENVNELLEDIVKIELKGTSPDADLELNAIYKLRDQLKKYIGCCDESTGKVTCDLWNENNIHEILSQKGFGNFNDSEVILTSEPHYSYLNSDYKITINTTTQGLYQLSDEVEEFMESEEGKGRGNISVFYFNDENQETFSDFITQFEDSKNTTHPFYERIIILDFDGSNKKVYYFISFNKSTANTHSIVARGFFKPLKQKLIGLTIGTVSKSPGGIIAGVLVDYTLSALADYFFDNDDNISYIEVLFDLISDRGLIGLTLSVVDNIIDGPISKFILGVAQYINENKKTWTAFGMLGAGGISIVAPIVGPKLAGYARSWLGDIAFLNNSTESLKKYLSMFWEDRVKTVKAWKAIATCQRKYRSNHVCLAAIKKIQTKFSGRTNKEIQDGIREKGFYRYCINGLGCFIKDTPVLMAGNPFKNIAPAVALAGMPLVAPIQDVQVDDMVKAYHNEDMYLTASNEDDIYVPGWQDYDYLDITPETWQVGKFVIIEEDGSLVEIEANRPKEWFEDYELKEKGDEVWLEIEEMGIAAYAVLQEIKSTDIDTRRFELNENGIVDRPVITTYKRIANEISDYTFSNGQVISCTPNHPFFSIDRHEYIPVGELNFGETVQTAGERAVRFIGGKSREKGEHVYNFEVWREHNYYVGSEGSEDFVLVHNSCGRNKKRFYQSNGKNQTPIEHIEEGHTWKNKSLPENKNKSVWNDKFDDPQKISELMDDLVSDTNPIWDFKPGSGDRVLRATIDGSNPKYSKYLEDINGVPAFGADKNGNPLTKFFFDIIEEGGDLTFKNGYPIP